jgi:hypothetical protein
MEAVGQVELVSPLLAVLAELAVVVMVTTEPPQATLLLDYQTQAVVVVLVLQTLVEVLGLLSLHI